MKSIQQLLELDEKRKELKALANGKDSNSDEYNEWFATQLDFEASASDAIHHLRALVEKCRVYERGLNEIIETEENFHDATLLSSIAREILTQGKK